MNEGTTVMTQLECPNCGCRVGNKITHSVPREITWRGVKRTTIRRRRVCRHCGLPWTTVEHIEDENNPGFPDAPPVVEHPDDPDEPNTNGRPSNPYVN